MTRIYSILGVVACLILGLDQWTKQIAIESLNFEGQSKAFLSWWHWTMVHNTAAAFGIFSKVPFIESDSLRIGFLLLVPIVVLGLLWHYHIRDFKPSETFRPVVIGLVIGGAIGNLIDRLRFSYVIDFIDWSYPSSSGKCIWLFYPGEGMRCHWPVFNIADSAITLAIVLIIAEVFIPGLQPKTKSGKR